MARTSKSILVAVVLWVVIIGGSAALIRYFVLPSFEGKKQTKLALQTGSEGKYKENIRIAVDDFSGYCVLRSSSMSKKLAKQGINLSIVNDSADYPARLKALAKGDVEMAVFPINSFIQCGVQLGDFPASIIYIIDETRGADAIIANKNMIAGIEALNARNARIITTPDSPSEFLSRVMIASFNLPELPDRKWMIKEDGSHAVYKRFLKESSKKPYAYAMWEPEVSKVLRDPNAHVLLDSSKVQGYIVDVLVANREFLVEQYDIARRVIESYAQVLYAARKDMPGMVLSDAEAIGARFSRTETENIVRGIYWKNTLENYAHFGLLDQDQALENIEDTMMKIIDVLLKTDAIKENPLEDKLNTIYFNRILKDMKSSGFHPGREFNILSGPAQATDEQVRDVKKLRRLSDEEWKDLVTVGTLRVNAIRFGRGTARISVQSNHELKALAKTLISWPSYYITVTGQVRPGGDDVAALQLAKVRADSAVKILLENGVTIERIRSRSQIGLADSAEAQSVTFQVGQFPY